jgi:hypothetical protein
MKNGRAKQKAEWERYAVGQPSTTRNWVNIDCCPFDTVSHVCHIDDAFRIFEDDEIRPSLVCDESKLRTTRTSVTWLSPNTWAAGSRYGSVSFEFGWKKLVEGKRFYWVEAISYYNPPAFRILVTDSDPKIALKRYDPRKDKGPLFYDANRDVWYRNGKYTGEFMFDGSLRLSDCNIVTFVKHHNTLCNKRPTCDNVGKEGHRCGARLLSRLIAQQVLTSKRRHSVRLFCEPNTKRKRLHFHAAHAWEYATRSLSLDGAGSITRKHPAALYVAAAILDRFGDHRKTAALCNLFRNREELRWAIAERAVKALGIDSPRGLVWRDKE